MHEIVLEELIGLKTRVVKSSHRGLEKISGTVVDETLQTLVIEQDGVEKTVPKTNTVFEFEFQGQQVAVDGKDIAFRPEDRIKKHWREFAHKTRSK